MMYVIGQGIRTGHVVGTLFLKRWFSLKLKIIHLSLNKHLFKACHSKILVFIHNSNLIVEIIKNIQWKHVEYHINMARYGVILNNTCHKC